MKPDVDTPLKRTALAEVHEALGAKMVPFAGFWMPVQYASITQEHRAVRERVGVFDISHMGEFLLEGPRALDAVQRVTVNDAASLAIDQAQYSAMVNADGGIVDDCVVYRLAEERWLVVERQQHRRIGSRARASPRGWSRCATTRRHLAARGSGPRAAAVVSGSRRPGRRHRLH
jgi:glycine cleavage system aminomethyltransferase T